MTNFSKNLNCDHSTRTRYITRPQFVRC